jgi:hypothetical protein
MLAELGIGLPSDCGNGAVFATANTNDKDETKSIDKPR